MPLRTYVLWRRLLHVWTLQMQGESLSGAAHAAAPGICCTSGPSMSPMSRKTVSRRGKASGGRSPGSGMRDCLPYSAVPRMPPTKSMRVCASLRSSWPSTSASDDWPY